MIARVRSVWLSKPEVVKPARQDECLRLFRSTPNNFEFVHNTVTDSFQSAEWISDASHVKMNEG